MSTIIFGLLHISHNKKNDMNIKIAKYDSLINIYFKNALLLKKSLEKQNIQFVLLTNNKRYLQELCLEDVNIKELNFNLSFPNNLNFYSAHYKLETFKYFASLKGDDIIGLFDLDMVVLKNINEIIRNIIQKDNIAVYDITDQVIPAYGQNFILDELRIIDSHIKFPKWYGGEFIVSNPKGFKILYDEVEPLIDVYKKKFNKIIHQGDEIITTIAIEKLKNKGYKFIDAGKIGLVGRFWSVPTKHKQKRFSYFANLQIIHLPADKLFLQKSANIKQFNENIFMKNYKRYLYLRFPIYILKKLKMMIKK